MEQFPGGNHFIGQSLTFSCVTSVNFTVDTTIQVNASWLGNSGNSLQSNIRRNITAVEKFTRGFRSNLTFYSLQSSDSGGYYCSSIVRPLTSSRFIESSDSVTIYRSVSAGN